MKFLKKLFKWILILIVLLVLLFVGIYLSAGFLVKTLVSSVVPTVTQTTASVQDVDISLFSGKIGLQGFAIGNPAGFSDKNIFELKNITISFDPASVLQDKIVVYDVTVDGVKVNAEANAKMQTNLGVLNKNIDDFLASGKKTAEPKAQVAAKDTAPATPGQSKAVVIKQLTIDNSGMEAGIGGKSLAVPLPKIQLNNIGENDNGYRGVSVG